MNINYSAELALGLDYLDISYQGIFSYPISG